MSWALLIPIIAREGLLVALKLAEKWGSEEPVTPADIQELKDLGAKTNKSQMLDALTRAGISLDDPKAKGLLALLGA